MYKIITLDVSNQVLDVEFYQTKPSDRMLKYIQTKALQRFKTNVKVKTEIVRYIDMGEIK